MPVFGMNPDIKRKVERVIKLGFIGLALVNVSTSMGLAVTAQFGPIPFNIAMMIYGLGQFVSTFIFSLILVHFGNQLRAQIQLHDLEEKVELDAKLKNMIGGAASVVMGQLPGVAGCIIMWTIGSAPWYWVFLFVIFISTPYTIVNATLAIFRDYSGGSGQASDDRANRPRSKDLRNMQTSPTSALASKVVDSTGGF